MGISVRHLPPSLTTLRIREQAVYFCWGHLHFSPSSLSSPPAPLIQSRQSSKRITRNLPWSHVTGGERIREEACGGGECGSVQPHVFSIEKLLPTADSKGDWTGAISEGGEHRSWGAGVLKGMTTCRPQPQVISILELPEHLHPF